jgi:hypothetical protein
MNWILILLMAGSGGSSTPAATTAVFADQAACEAGKAAGEMEIIKRTCIKTLNWLCVPERR